MGRLLNPEDRSPRGKSKGETEPLDWTLCKRLATEYGVVGVPASPFYSSADYLLEPNSSPLARFAYCKQDSTLEEASRRLRQVKSTLDLTVGNKVKVQPK